MNEDERARVVLDEAEFGRGVEAEVQEDVDQATNIGGGGSSSRIMSGDQVRRILFEGKGDEAADAAGEFFSSPFSPS